MSMKEDVRMLHYALLNSGGQEARIFSQITHGIRASLCAYRLISENNSILCLQGPFKTGEKNRTDDSNEI